MQAAQGQRSFLGTALPVAQPCSCRPRIASTIEAAHKKGGGSTKNGRDSNGQRRGVKVYGGQPVKAGGIIVRQVGCKVAQLTHSSHRTAVDRPADRHTDGCLLQFHPGVGVCAAVDWSLYAVKEGIVVFSENSKQQKVSLLALPAASANSRSVSRPSESRPGPEQLWCLPDLCGAHRGVRTARGPRHQARQQARKAAGVLRSECRRRSQDRLRQGGPGSGSGAVTPC